MLRLTTFGGLTLAVDDGLVTGTMTQRRRMALLSLLAVAGQRGMSRDKILACRRCAALVDLVTAAAARGGQARAAEGWRRAAEVGVVPDHRGRRARGELAGGLAPGVTGEANGSMTESHAAASNGGATITWGNRGMRTTSRPSAH